MIALLPLRLAQAQTDKSNIIYESKTITQKKGQSFDSVLKQAKLSEYQRGLVKAIPILHAAKSDRELRFSYLLENNKRLLREVRVTRGNRMANFVLAGNQGEHHFIQSPSKIPEKQVKKFAPAVILTSTRDTNTDTSPPVLTAVIVTQRQGKPLNKSLDLFQFSALQRRLIESGDFTKQAHSDRELTAFFETHHNKRLLKGFRVKRGANQVVYQVKKVSGQLRLVNVKQLKKVQQQAFKQQIRTAQSKHLRDNTLVLATSNPNITLSSTPTPKKPATAKKASKKTTLTNLVAITFDQHPGQTLQQAWQAIKLSQLQKNIILSGDFIKQAKSKRQLTLYFDNQSGKRLLRGLRVKRNATAVNYVVTKTQNQFTLTNLKTLAAERQAINQQFTQARIIQFASVAPTATKKTSPVKLASTEKNQTDNHRSALPTISRQGRFTVLTATQNPGKSLTSALKALKLSQLQRNLIADMPASKSAKTSRKIHLLFEQQGKQKYLRAIRVVRGQRVAEYALIQYKGKWTWANDQGQIKTGGGGFARYPVRFSRISSPFNLRRRHPITRRIRPHRGTDFKAPHGTPIHAPAAGTVVFAGRQRGYGIVLEIDHGNGYHTKYAHLSRIMRSARKGRHISKGQFIAKVGNTGISTGSHLHYEVIVNGVHRNPMTVRLPSGGVKVVSAGKTAFSQYIPRLRRMTR